MKKLLVLALIALLCTPLTAIAAAKKVPHKVVPAGKSRPEMKPAKVSQADVLALADKYIAATEPKLKLEDRQTISTMVFHLKPIKNISTEHEKMVGNFVDQLTIILAGGKSNDSALVASAYLVKSSPDNSRTTNLFGSALHQSDKFADAVAVLEFTLSMSPQSTLAMLNLATTCLDANQDDRAKALLDKIVKVDPDNRDAYRTLAYYWYKKKNNAMAIECLKKAAQFVGVVKQKSKPKDEEIQHNEIEADDPVESMEAKTKVLAKSVPFTTADVIEDSFPNEARQIREKYGKLIDSEKMIMPRLPEFNSSSNKTFTENMSIVGAWIQVPQQRFAEYQKARARDKYGITGNESDKELEAKGKKAAQKEMSTSFENVRQTLEYMKKMPGISKAQLAQAEAQLKQAARQNGVKLSSAPVKKDAPPGFDTGTPFAKKNYVDYILASRGHEQYIMRLLQDYQANETDILAIYQKKVKAEDEHHQQLWDKLQKEHNKPGNPHGVDDIPCRKEMIRHKKALNQIGLDYYKQWANLYMPTYAKKIKPALDDYWYVSMLYIKNMHDPKVMEREYYRVKNFFLLQAQMATGHMAIGGMFGYVGPTDEEEAALQQAIRQAEEEAKQKKPQYLQDFDSPKTDWVQWIGDHLSFEVSCEFLSLKITASTIEFEAWAFGPSGSMKIDMVNSTLETSTGLQAKGDFGVKVFGMGAKLEGKADFIKKTCQWDFENGTYKESYGGKVEGKATLGPAALSGEVGIDSQLVAKGAVNASVSGGGFTAQQSLLDF